MIVTLDSSGRPGLAQADNFRAFAVEVDAPRGRFDTIAAASLPLVRFDGPNTAWVNIDTLAGFDAFASTEAAAALRKMIEGARPYGWVSEDGTAIKSHVVWADGAGGAA